MTTFYGPQLARIHAAGYSGAAPAAAAFVGRELRARGITRGTVADLGCGSGELAAGLAREGYDVLGVDVSAAMLDLARRTAPSARLVHGSAWGIELPACVAVLGFGEGLSYLGTEDPLSALPDLLARAAQRLAPGGLLAFDCIVRSQDEPQCYDAMREGEGWRVQVAVREDPECSLLTRRITAWTQEHGHWRRSDEVHVQRTFEPAALAALLAAAGLQPRLHSGWGSAPLPPRRVLALGRKTKGA